MDLDFLNDLCVGLQPSETVYQPHPHGTFKAEISSIVKKSRDEGTSQEKKMYEMFIKTDHGTASHTKWCVTELEGEQAKVDPKVRDKVISNIIGHKKLMIDLGIWTKQEAAAKNWNDIEAAYSSVVGLPCQIAVKPNVNKPGKTITFVNAYRADFVDVLDRTDSKYTANRSMSGLNSTPPTSGIRMDTNSTMPGIGSMDDDLGF